MADKIQKPWWQPAVTIFTEVVGWIALPIVAALYAGRYLDEKFDSYPWFFLGLTAAAFIITSVGIVRVAMKYIKQIEKESIQPGEGENKIKIRKNSIIDNDESGDKHN